MRITIYPFSGYVDLVSVVIDGTDPWKLLINQLF